jgi:outer membrane protein insertion porin family
MSTRVFRALASVLITFSCLAAANSPCAAQSGESYNVSDVEIEGNRRIDTAAVRSQLATLSGRVTGAQLSEDVKTLYNSGYFDQVIVGVVPHSNGTVTIKFTVTEKPIARKILIKGNDEVSEDDLADVLKLEGRRFVDKSKLQALVRKGTAYYQSQGYYDAGLDYTTTPVDDNEIDVTFHVTEGKLYRVRDVILQGGDDLNTDEMLAGIQTQTYKWWSSWLFGTGKVSEEMTEADKQILGQYLLDHGYIEGQVGQASIEKREDGLYVVFDITEGQQFKIGKITASGDLVENSQEKTVEELKTEPDDVFNASKVRADIFTITDRFGDEGYAFANVVPNTRLNKDEGIVDLDFTSTKGKPVKIGKITITGNEKTYDNVIRRELRIEEQHRYSGTKIRRSQTMLQRLGIFDEATINNKPTSDPAVVDLDVNVKEGTTGSFTAGAGYSTANGTIFNTKLSENNLFGTGNKLNLNLDFGSQISNQVLSYDMPRVDDTHLSAGFDLLRTTRQYQDFNRELNGGSASIGYPGEILLGESWAQDLSLTLKYELLSIDIHDVAEDSAQLVKDSRGLSTSSAVTPALIRSTIDNPVNPTKGSRQNVSIELSGLGGDQNFYLFEARNAWYYPLFKGDFGEITFADRTSFGYGESFNDEPFPLFRRFFPGGLNSVRGYANRTLGPTDINGQEYGGNKQLINNVEMIFPLVTSAGLRGVVFYDVGQAYDDGKPIDVNQLRQGIGYGIRWNSPMGPIRFEVGYPVNRQPDEPAVQTMFSFGGPT